MNLNNQTTVNVQEKSNLIWAIADLIRDFSSMKAGEIRQ